MDMGITGRKAIVCAASKGLGKGCAMALERTSRAQLVCCQTARSGEAQCYRPRAGATQRLGCIHCSVSLQARITADLRTVNFSPKSGVLIERC